ncbi:winged helix-turn-helix domain-containing protein [Pantoea tagorei]
MAKPLRSRAGSWRCWNFFLRNPGRVLTRAQLEEKLYSWDADVSSNAVEVHIHHLRKKLGAAFIRTVHGVGYMLGEPQ